MRKGRAEAYHRDDLRGTLLDVAAVMIAEAGVESVTMRALSERIGVSRTAAYRHFADKAALLAAVAEEGFKRLERCLEAGDVLAAGGPASAVLARLQHMGIAYICFAIENPAHYRLMFDADQAPAAAAGSAGQAVFAQLLALIKLGQSTGAIRPGEPRALAQTTWALVHGMAALAINGRLGRVAVADDLAVLATATLIHGLAR